MMFVLRTVYWMYLNILSTVLPQSTALDNNRSGDLVYSTDKLSSGHVQLRDLYLHFTKMKTILWSCLSNVQCSSASPVIHFPNTVLWGRGGRGSDKLGLNVPWNNWEDTFFSQPMWNHWLLSLKLKINYVSGYLYIDKVVSEAVNKKGVKILNLLMIRNVQKWKTLDFK